MTILVTGANGGVGKALFPLLRAYYNEQVICTDRAKMDCNDYFACDLNDVRAVASLIKNIGPRLIFHLAGSFTGQFETDFQVNTLSVKFIFDSILAEDLETRVLVFGSAAEYGAIKVSDNPIPETLPCRPVSIYGLTKVFQTDMAKYYARTKGIDVVVARVFNIAAPGLSQRLFYGRAEAMISAYQKGEITQLEFGNLDNARDYIEMDKAADQLLAIAERGISGEVYNVGSGIPKKIRSILKDLLNEKGVPEDAVAESIPEIIRGKGFDVQIIYADISKVSKLMVYP
jgi:nucleoside-diphosphate-sugar epimerase